MLEEEKDGSIVQETGEELTGEKKKLLLDSPIRGEKVS